VLTGSDQYDGFSLIKKIMRIVGMERNRLTKKGNAEKNKRNEAADQFHHNVF
jgi:hypothetical protein